MDDLYCLLGPSIGFNREILLYRPSLQDPWRLPSAEMVQAFLYMFDLSDAPRAKPVDFGRRPRPPDCEGLPIQLRAEYLPRDRFAEIDARMQAMAPDSWCFKEYRQVIHRDSVCDWQTLGAAMFMFHHLDK